MAKKKPEKSEIRQEIDDELEDEGIPRPRGSRDDIPLSGDEAIFKHIVITPEHPIEYIKDENNRIQAISHLSRTMALGNLTQAQMSAMNDYFQIANELTRISEQCPGLDYFNTANRYYLKIVQMCLTSQNEGGKLLTMAMTEQHHYGIHRMDQSVPEEEKDSGPLGGLMGIHEKIKGAANRQTEIAAKYGK